MLKKAVFGAVAIPAAVVLPGVTALAAPAPQGPTTTAPAPQLKSLGSLTLADLPTLSNLEITSRIEADSTKTVKFHGRSVSERTVTFTEDAHLPGYTAATEHVSIHWKFDGKTIVGYPSVGEWHDVNFPVCTAGTSTIAEYLYGNNTGFVTDRRLDVGISTGFGCAQGGSVTIQAHVTGAGDAYTN